MSKKWEYNITRLINGKLKMETSIQCSADKILINHEFQMLNFRWLNLTIYGRAGNEGF